MGSSSTCGAVRHPGPRLGVRDDDAISNPFLLRLRPAHQQLPYLEQTSRQTSRQYTPFGLRCTQSGGGGSAAG